MRSAVLLLLSTFSSLPALLHTSSHLTSSSSPSFQQHNAASATVTPGERPVALTARYELGALLQALLQAAR